MVGGDLSADRDGAGLNAHTAEVVRARVLSGDKGSPKEAARKRTNRPSRVPSGDERASEAAAGLPPGLDPQSLTLLQALGEVKTKLSRLGLAPRDSGDSPMGLLPWGSDPAAGKVAEQLWGLLGAAWAQGES